MSQSLPTSLSAWVAIGRSLPINIKELVKGKFPPRNFIPLFFRSLPLCLNLLVLDLQSRAIWVFPRSVFWRQGAEFERPYNINNPSHEGSSRQSVERVTCGFFRLKNLILVKWNLLGEMNERCRQRIYLKKSVKRKSSLFVH